MKGKIGSLEEKIECEHRLKTANGESYCRGFIRDCPYINLQVYETLLTAEFFRCDYFRIFDGLKGDEK